MTTQQPEALAQECADYATSLRSAANVAKLEGRAPPVSFLRAADLFERAASRITELEAQLEAVGAGGVSLYGGDSYGDGNVYRGARSADSKTCTFYAIALAQRGREIDEYYAQHLALELECMLIDPNEWWDSAAKVLDAYKAAWSEINPGPPTFMGEPVPPERKAIYAAIRAQRAAAQGEKP
jgi:hypothetical protein